VYVRQLGPFVATVAEATTLCWRLERSGCCDPQQPATRISFEVAAEVRQPFACAHLAGASKGAEC
jgi:hypothetical protein